MAVGKLILVVGPSGSGKSALLSYLHAQRPDIIFPVSCTTRSPRPGEVEGEKYFFVTKADFEKREIAGEFMEWAAYGGHYYGTLRSQIEPALAGGKTVVREVEVQGARQLLESTLHEQIRVIFIDAGLWEALEQRILARAPMSEPELLARRKRYEDELTFKIFSNIVVKNPDGGLEQAKKDFIEAVRQLELE